MARKDPRFNPEYQKITQQTRESTNQIQGKEIGNSTILTEHLLNDCVTNEKLSATTLRVYTTGGWVGSTSDRNAPVSNGMYNMWGYNNAANSPATYTAGIGFGLGVQGSVEIAGSWTPGGLWTRHLRDCCQNWTGWASITIGAYSDKRRKADIRPIENSLEIIKKLEPVTYLERHPDGSVGKIDPSDRELKKQNIREYGLIAQDVIKIVPEVVTHIKCNEPSDLNADWASAYELDYSRLVPILIASMQEQQEKIDSLEARLKALEDLLK